MTDQYDAEALAEFNRTGRRQDPILGKRQPLSAGDRVQIEQAAARARAVAEPSPPEDDVCALSGLVRSGCSHCRPRAPRPPVIVDGKSRIFEARRSGTCDVCGARFDAGVLIARLPDGDGYAGPCHRGEP